jgi:hypothetical protein
MAATPKNPNAGKQVIGSTPIPRNTGPGLASKPVPGAKVNNYDMTVVGGAMPSHPVKTSGLAGKSGVLGGQHAGGHSDVAAAKAAESMFAKDIASGKVKDLDAERRSVLKKTGAWPNGATN